MKKINLVVDNGFAQIFVLMGMLVIAISLPIATKLVQQNQENRSNAASKCSCSKSGYGSASTCARAKGTWKCITSSSSSSCTNGAYKCATTTRYKCINGKWQYYRSCPNGCDGTSCKATTKPTCTSFTYGNWGACDSANLKHRSVTGSSPSGCTGGSPVTTQACNSNEVCTSFTYSDWSSCSSGRVQTRTVKSSSPSGCTGGSPVTSRSCTPASNCSYLNCSSCTEMSTCKSALCNWEILTKSCSKPTTKLASQPGINLSQYDKDVRQIVKEKGYETREGVVAAALYLAQSFPYQIVYHSKGGTVNDVYQLKSGFLSKYDNTYTNYFGATTKLKDSSGRTIVGLSCSGLVEWAYRTAGFDAGLKESQQNIDTTTVTVTNSDGTKSNVQKSHWINLAGGTDSSRRKKVLDTVKPGDLVYTENIDGIRHEAVITAIDANTNTVTIVQSSASEGVNVAYIDLVTLKAKNGSKNNFSFYASLDGYYQLYGGTGN